MNLDTHEVKWCMRYTGRGPVVETARDGSIRSAPKGAKDMVVLDRAMRPVVRIDLKEDGGGWTPIFYRIRAANVTTSGQTVGGSEDIATVFGRVRSDNMKTHAQLWAIKDGKMGDCPKPWIRENAIRLQTES